MSKVEAHKIEAQRARCEKLQSEMHHAPMNKIFTDHKGNKSLGTHSTAWADRSREWADARRLLDCMEESR